MRRGTLQPLVGAAVLVALALLHLHLNRGGVSSLWRRAQGRPGRGELVVGFLPVTCHLTCPVTNWVTAHSSGGVVFRSKKYTDWATVAEELKGGGLRASFLLAPLAMSLRRQGVPIKIVYLGHRDGTTLIVRHDSTARSLADLRGKTLAIPHNYSNQRILLAREMERQGLREDELRLVAYPPPEMPSALQKGLIDGYIVGEPVAAKAELEGIGRVLAFSKDLWPNFISCVLVVQESLIREDRALVEELVSGIARSGLWLDAPGQDLAPGVSPAGAAGAEASGGLTLPAGWDASHRSQAAALAARREYYSQDPALLRYVLTRPPDRVRYTDLRLARADFAEIQRYAERLGYFRPATREDPFSFDDYCDPSFGAAAGAAK